MDESFITVAIDTEADYALLAIGMAWVAILGMLAAGVIADAWRRVRAWQAALMDEAVTRCLRCAARPVCETGSVAGWQAGHAGCPNVERLTRAPQGKGG
jgi:hypothetical protein